MKFLFCFMLMVMMVSCAQQRSGLISELPEASFKDLYTLDVYRDNNLLHVLLSGVDKKSHKIALKYLFSRDAGENWSVPVTINQGIAPVKRSVRGNDFQIAAKGDHLLVAWQTEGSVPWAGLIVLAESFDQGKTWRKLASPVSQELSMIDQGYFDLAADRQGNYHITWLDDRDENGNFQVLRYARLLADQHASGWQANQKLDGSVCTCCWTKIMADEKSGMHVLFRDDEPRDMKLISSKDGGASWSRSISVSAFNWEFVGCPHQGGGMAIANQGDQVTIHSVIWNGSESGPPGLYYSHSLRADMATWKPVLPVNENISFSGDIALLDRNNIALAYEIGTAGEKRIEVIQSMDAGNSWSKAKVLSREGVAPSHPRLIGTTDGYRVFWTEKSQKGHSVWKMAAL